MTACRQSPGLGIPRRRVFLAGRCDKGVRIVVILDCSVCICLSGAVPQRLERSYACGDSDLV